MVQEELRSFSGRCDRHRGGSRDQFRNQSEGRLGTLPPTGSLLYRRGFRVFELPPSRARPELTTAWLTGKLDLLKLNAIGLLHLGTAGAYSISCAFSVGQALFLISPSIASLSIQLSLVCRTDVRVLKDLHGVLEAATVVPLVDPCFLGPIRIESCQPRYDTKLANYRRSRRMCLGCGGVS